MPLKTCSKNRSKHWCLCLHSWIIRSLLLLKTPASCLSVESSPFKYSMSRSHTSAKNTIHSLSQSYTNLSQFTACLSFIQKSFIFHISFTDFHSQLVTRNRKWKWSNGVGIAAKIGVFKGFLREAFGNKRTSVNLHLTALRSFQNWRFVTFKSHLCFIFGNKCYGMGDDQGSWGDFLLHNSPKTQRPSQFCKYHIILFCVSNLWIFPSTLFSDAFTSISRTCR